MPLVLDDSGRHAGGSAGRVLAPCGPGPVPRLAAELMAVGGLFTLILVLRSRVSFDFIYFQF